MCTFLCEPRDSREFYYYPFAFWASLLFTPCFLFLALFPFSPVLVVNFFIKYVSLKKIYTVISDCLLQQAMWSRAARSHSWFAAGSNKNDCVPTGFDQKNKIKKRWKRKKITAQYKTVPTSDQIKYVVPKICLLPILVVFVTTQLGKDSRIDWLMQARL